jgi:hypothetical protein
MLRRTRLIVALAAMAMLIVGGVAYASGDAPHPHGWFDLGHHHGGFGHRGHGLGDRFAAGSITKVDGSTLTITGRDGHVFTVKTDAGTKVFAGGQTGTVSDLQVGWLAFAFNGRDGFADVIRAASKATVVNDRKRMRSWAKSHHVAAGKITAVGADSLTLTGRDGTPVVVKVATGTKIYALRQRVQLNALKTGWFAFAVEDSNGVARQVRAASAAAIRHHFGHHHLGWGHGFGGHVVVGKITGLGTGTVTVTGRDGHPVTVKVDSGTKVFEMHNPITAGDLKTGWFAFVVEGKDGVADVIRAADPSQFPGAGGGSGGGGTVIKDKKSMH